MLGLLTATAMLAMIASAAGLWRERRHPADPRGFAGLIAVAAGLMVFSAPLSAAALLLGPGAALALAYPAVVPAGYAGLRVYQQLLSEPAAERR